MDMKVFKKAYTPRQCGYCAYLIEYPVRTPEVTGFCEWLGREVYRADFCHRQDEQRRHEAAKEAYVITDCRQGRSKQCRPVLPGSK